MYRFSARSGQADKSCGGWRLWFITANTANPRYEDRVSYPAFEAFKHTNTFLALFQQLAVKSLIICHVHILAVSTLTMYSKLFSLLACLGLVSSAPITTIVGRSEAGPVDTNNFPDPCIINYDNTWYSFATRTIGSAVHIQVAKSTDFAHWVAVTNSDGSEYDALPTLGAWVNQTNWNTWAPDVSELVSISNFCCLLVT